jgi:hypothetical protein
LFPDYTPNSGVFARVDFRGVGAILTLEANSTRSHSRLGRITTMRTTDLN